jgi:uncharacterized protein
MNNGKQPKLNMKQFDKKVAENKTAFKRFLTKLEKQDSNTIYNASIEVDKAVWKEVDCLSCGNCCKKMTPTFTTEDIKRIATHLRMTPKDFKAKWLYKEPKDGDWVNTTQPCQFLNLKDNKCSIYEVRPADCAGFPHFTKKKPELYIHVHKQNIEYCPAAYKFVEKMKALF